MLKNAEAFSSKAKHKKHKPASTRSRARTSPFLLFPSLSCEPSLAGGQERERGRGSGRGKVGHESFPRLSLLAASRRVTGNKDPAARTLSISRTHRPQRPRRARRRAQRAASCWRGTRKRGRGRRRFVLRRRVFRRQVFFFASCETKEDRARNEDSGSLQLSERGLQLLLALALSLPSFSLSLSPSRRSSSLFLFLSSYFARMKYSSAVSSSRRKSRKVGNCQRTRALRGAEGRRGGHHRPPTTAAKATTAAAARSTRTLRPSISLAASALHRSALRGGDTDRSSAPSGCSRLDQGRRVCCSGAGSIDCCR